MSQRQGELVGVRYSRHAGAGNGTGGPRTAVAAAQGAGPCSNSHLAPRPALPAAGACSPLSLALPFPVPALLISRQPAQHHQAVVTLSAVVAGAAVMALPGVLFTASGI
jgi:hypothetical protein